MSEQEPDGPYVYQPLPATSQNDRAWCVAHLTKVEAEMLLNFVTRPGILTACHDWLMRERSQTHRGEETRWLKWPGC